jgi:uncharacterized protein YutE (UPF0331/DUF86 family)
VVDEIVLSKIGTIERRLARAREVYAGDPKRLDDLTTEDSVVLNLLRACDASIDISMRIVSRRRLGIPKDTAAAFDLLQHACVLSPSLCERMRRMIRFRQIALHDCTGVDRNVLLPILDERLSDFEEFCRAVLA